MIDDATQTEIRRRLAAVEAEQHVRVLFACESGSRAWGFPSRDSDYDVRFIYVHRLNWYLSIADRRDVIERSLENKIDLSGWDLRKALGLFRKSNPPLLEWLQAGIIYRQEATFAARLRALLPRYYSPKQCIYHYHHMAKGNIRVYLKGETVWVKKYFYVLRPLLACRWIERGLGPVPMEFSTLVDRVTEPGPLRASIEELLAKKVAGVELDEGPRVPIFHEFFDQEMPRLEAVAEDMLPGTRADVGELDRLFCETVMQSDNNELDNVTGEKGANEIS
jgi:predicted nucleotidyltransferase